MPVPTLDCWPRPLRLITPLTEVWDIQYIWGPLASLIFLLLGYVHSAYLLCPVCRASSEMRLIRKMGGRLFSLLSPEPRSSKNGNYELMLCKTQELKKTPN